ncbi:MAG TPA: 1-phosphofructokinase, partial [Erysipelotrichaceae bacterium]|nr:1-phosphofructokinase [Erysipelotrichaceae bacterium]
MIITVTLNPAIDKTSYIEKLKLNSLNRINNLKIEIGGKGINVSKTLKSLNEETICLGFIGGYTG